MGVSGLSALQVQPFGGGLIPFDFDPALIVWSDDMAKRAIGNVFTTAPIVQGKWDNSGTPDELTFPRGDQIHGDFYANFGGNQAGINCWYTPEIANADRATGDSYIYYLDADNYLKYDWDNSRFEVGIDAATITRAQALVAGTAYLLAVRWQMSGPIDGTNYGALGVDDAYTYGITSAPSVTPTATMYLGSDDTPEYSADGLIEGFDVRRVPWFDGSYGVSLIYGAAGPLDELADIATGRDPALTNNGSWDFPLFLPTDQAAGALVTGTGEAWSHPHSSNLMSHGWHEDGFYGGGDWGVLGNGSSTTINCGSAAALDDMPNGANGWTYDFWVRPDGGQYIAFKGVANAAGYRVFINPDGTLTVDIECATTDALSTTATVLTAGKWYHIAIAFRSIASGGDSIVYIAINGAWEASYTVQNTGVGAYITDAAASQMFGRIVSSLDGVWGWQRFSDINTRFKAGLVPVPATDDFIAPRAFPAADGNTIEAWSFADGTGANIVAQVASPGNDGTLANGTWEPQWNQLGTPVEFHGVEYNATTTSGVIPDAARIQDLHGAAMCAEAWVRADGWGEASAGRIFDKNAGVVGGWRFAFQGGSQLEVRIEAATDAVSRTTEFSPDGKLHLLTFQYDNGGDKKAYIWVDGIPVTTYSWQQAAVGVIVTDVGNDLYHGNSNGGNATWDGLLGGWARVSSVLRYTNGEAFVPDSPFNPPAPDANTAWQTDFSDGAGATLTDDSAGANNCTLTNYEWLNSFDMNDISPGSRIYGGQGYIVGSDGANDGIIETFTGLTPGDDYVLRFVGHPGPDSNGHLNVLVYDEIGAANITDFDLPWYTGLHTGANNSATLIAAAGTFSQRQVGARIWNITDLSASTITAVSGDGTTVTGVLAGGTDNDWDTNDVFRITWAQTGSVGNVIDRYPFNENFSFELPAGCTSISVRYEELGGAGSWWIDQVEMYPNLIDNPSMEGAWAGGPPALPAGWINVGLDPGDIQTSSTGAGIIHSGSEAGQFNVGAGAGESLQSPAVGVAGDFAVIGGWRYNGGTVYSTHGELHSTLATPYFSFPNTAAWSHGGAVFRLGGTLLRPEIHGRAATCYADDFYTFILDPVSLTATPANEANSTEGTGIRIDGFDNAPQPIPAGNIFATEGWVRITVTPRHDIADMDDFGNTQPRFFHIWGDATNYIMVRISAANTVQLLFDDGGGLHNAVWAAAGALVADTEYLMEVIWSATQMWLVVDAVIRITIVQPVSFVTVPTQLYPGSTAAGLNQIGAVFGPPA